jgi:hypothetical protein
MFMFSGFKTLRVYATATQLHATNTQNEIHTKCISSKAVEMVISCNKNNSKQTHSCKFLETGSRVSTA